MDFLAESGQTYWQILPLGPVGFGNSPYMCFSAFAGNPLLISPERLVEGGLLEAADVENLPSCRPDKVDYSAVIKLKALLLEKAFAKFKQKYSKSLPDDYYTFMEQNIFWLEDYSLFMALKETNGGRIWKDWDSRIAHREPTILELSRNQLSENIKFYKFTQYLFYQQWKELKDYSHSKQIKIIGDMPLYVAYDSVDVWVNRHLFDLDAKGNPKVIAGVPPDYFSNKGQRWGNPIYRWDIMAQTGYKWWIDRFKLNFKLFDLLRLDHFRGYEAYWEIPSDQTDAVVGRWVKGPGAALFKAVQSKLGNLPVIAEDLGVITDEVEILKDKFGFPGMRILQMAFGNDPKARDYKPHNYPRNCVVYSATHDHNTTRGWFTAQPGSQSTQSAEEIQKERKDTLEYINSDGQEINWDFIRLAMSSVSNLTIFPMQDVLGLDTKSRMNLPGTIEGNWEWRMTSQMITSLVTHMLKEMTRIYERSLFQ